MLSSLTRRRVAKPALLLAVVAGAVGGGPLATSIAPADLSVPFPSSDDAVQARLNQLVDVDFQERPLREVLQEIADLLQVNFVVRWDQLEANAVTGEKVVSLRLSHQSVHRVLSMLLEQISVDVHLEFDVLGGVLIVSTAEDLNRPMETRIYPISDLLMVAGMQGRFAPEDPDDTPTLMSSHLLRFADQAYRESHALESVRATSTMFDDSAASQNLIDLIVSTVSPDSWQMNGGRGTLQEFGGKLVVHGPRKLQRETERFLGQLRVAVFSTP